MNDLKFLQTVVSSIYPKTYSITQVGKEYCLDLPIDKNFFIRIFTSIDVRSKSFRKTGKDAIRLVLWSQVLNQPVGNVKRVNRVNQETLESRLKDRIDSLLRQYDRVKDQKLDVDWDYVRAILQTFCLINPRNNFAQSLKTQIEQRGNLSSKQLLYVLGNKNPRGFQTFEAQVKHVLPKVLDYLEELKQQTRNSNQTNSCQTYVEYEERKELDLSKIRCIATKEYKRYKYPFEIFNPVQSAVFPYIEEDINLVISAATSVGKTVIAELLMDFHLDKGDKVVYLSPLKSLTQEKYDDWKVRYKDKKICIMTGDYRLSAAKKKEAEEADIVVLTSEMMDSRTRHFETEQNTWLFDIGLVVVDEAHIITMPGRGDAVEVGLMRFTKYNQKARILFLSATMPNVEHLEKWLTKLNGKESKNIYSSWRPVELEVKWYPYSGANYGARQQSKLKQACKIVEEIPNQKFLIFVHSKKDGHLLVKKLKARDIDAKFHNADLTLEQRLDIENEFRDRSPNSLRVLVATSTLAWGCNLPARNVVITGTHRGTQEVDILDIIQMMGRAGRVGIDDKGTVHMIVLNSQKSKIKLDIQRQRPIVSVLVNKSVLAFHLLADIHNGEIQTVADVFKWFDRSLAKIQNQTLNAELIEDVFRDLQNLRMIKFEDGELKLTHLGRISVWMYYSPYDIKALFDNLRKVIDLYGPECVEDYLILSYVLACIPSNESYVSEDALEAYQYFYTKLIRSYKTLEIPNAYVTAFLAWIRAFGQWDYDLELQFLYPMMSAFQRDIGRIEQTLILIDSYAGHWKISPYISTLNYRVTYGVGPEMIELVKIKHIGAARAKLLYDAGYKSKRDLIIAGKEKIADLLGWTLTNKIWQQFS